MLGMAIFLASSLVSVWLLAIAIVAMQNAEPVTLWFLTFQSVPIPFGFVFACSVVIGLLAGGLWQIVFPANSKKKTRRPPNRDRV